MSCLAGCMLSPIACSLMFVFHILYNADFKALEIGIKNKAQRSSSKHKSSLFQFYYAMLYHVSLNV